MQAAVGLKRRTDFGNILVGEWFLHPKYGLSKVKELISVGQVTVDVIFVSERNVTGCLRKRITTQVQTVVGYAGPVWR